MAELRRRYGLAEGPIAVVGASIGTLVGLSALAAGELRVNAIALVSPGLRLASVVGANERRFAFSYRWSADSRAVAAELDFVTRAREIARERAPMLPVVGADDDAEGIARPAEELASALVAEAVVRIPQMGHALADEPGLEPAPQSAAAVAVDGVVAAWLRQHLPWPLGRCPVPYREDSCALEMGRTHAFGPSPLQPLAPQAHATTATPTR